MSAADENKNAVQPEIKKARSGMKLSDRARKQRARAGRKKERWRKKRRGDDGRVKKSEKRWRRGSKAQAEDSTVLQKINPNKHV